MLNSDPAVSGRGMCSRQCVAIVVSHTAAPHGRGCAESALDEVSTYRNWNRCMGTWLHEEMSVWGCVYGNLWSFMARYTYVSSNDVTKIAEFLTHLTMKTQSQKDEFFK